MREPSTDLISIIVPVYNEGMRIIDNLEVLTSEVENYFSRFEILVVSDGSTDETNFKVFQFKYPGLKLIIVDKNQGKGAAIRKGFAAAQGRYIFFIDGGMEIHPKELKIFFGLMEIYEADIVVGSKRHPQSKIDYPWFRKLLSFFYQILIRKMFKVDVTDTQVGMKLFRREVIQAVAPFLGINRYGFDLEILSLATMFGYRKILEAPVQMDYFVRNKRNVLAELAHVFRVGIVLLKDTLQLYLRIRKIRGDVKRAHEAA